MSLVAGQLVSAIGMSRTGLRVFASSSATGEK